MIVNAQVPLRRLILSLSQALDYVYPNVADQQHRTAYIATRIARQLGFTDAEVFTVFVAAALHDIGLIRDDHKLQLRAGGADKLDWHCEVGYELLRTDPLFAGAAEIVRYHHTPWEYGRGAARDGRPVPLASHIVHLADAVELAIKREIPVLEQPPAIIRVITRDVETQFHPDCVEAWRAVSAPEAFWLDCVSARLYGVLLEGLQTPWLTVDEHTIQPIARMFAQVVDAASPWTATHTAGVAASAVELARRLSFSPREQMLMQAAGYFHDLGKLTVPAAILDKPGRLAADERNAMRAHTYHTFHVLNTIGGMPQIAEWAAFHHERLDGEGYPFQHDARNLTLGARIMAVADVFTAMIEDRPYRRGLDEREVLAHLRREVAGGALDGDVVAALGRDLDVIDAARREVQADYSAQQQRLTHLVQPAHTETPVAAGQC